MMRKAGLALIAIFMAAPLLVVGAVSLNGKRILAFPPQGLSLQWWGELFIDPGWRGALGASLGLAAVAAALAVAIALPLAYALWRGGSKLAQGLRLLGVAPFMLPPVITALGFLSFWAATGFYGQPPTAIISHAIFLTALPLVTLTLGFSGVDPALPEAARTMGASEWVVARTVILPLVLPYAVSGYAFAFVLSLNEYVIAYMTVGFTMETIPIKIFNALRYGYTPTMAAAAFLFAALAALAFGLVARFGDLPALMGAWRKGETPE